MLRFLKQVSVAGLSRNTSADAWEAKFVVDVVKIAQCSYNNTEARLFAMRFLTSNAIALTLGAFCLLQSIVEGQLPTDPLAFDPTLNVTDPTINSAGINVDPNIYYYKPPTTLPYPSQPQCTAPACSTGSCYTPQCYSVPPVCQSCSAPPVPPCVGVTCGYNGNGACNSGCGANFNGGYFNGNSPVNNGGYCNGAAGYNNGGCAYNNRGCGFNNGGYSYNYNGQYNNGGYYGPERGCYGQPQCPGYQNGGYQYQNGGYQY